MREITTYTVTLTPEATREFEARAAVTTLPIEGIALIDHAKYQIKIGSIDADDLYSAREHLYMIADALETDSLSAADREDLPMMLRQLAYYASNEKAWLEPIGEYDDEDEAAPTPDNVVPLRP